MSYRCCGFYYFPGAQILRIDSLINGVALAEASINFWDFLMVIVEIDSPILLVWYSNLKTNV